MGSICLKKFNWFSQLLTDCSSRFIVIYGNRQFRQLIPKANRDRDDCANEPDLCRMAYKRPAQLNLLNRTRVQPLLNSSNDFDTVPVSSRQVHRERR